MAHDKKEPQNRDSTLRQDAEKSWRDKGGITRDSLPKAEMDAQALVHELRVHQIELEMQNEELHASRNEVEKMLGLYADLYDFAPVGYLTLDADAVIRQANLTAVKLTRVEREQLIGMPLYRLVGAAHRANLKDFLDSIFSQHKKQVCELELEENGSGILWVRLEGTASPEGRECLVVMSDVSQAREIADAQRFLLENSWLHSGEDFFHMLARFLAEKLNMEFICIDRLEGNGQMARTLANYYDGHFEDNISYALKDTPCGVVVGQRVCSFPKDVQKLFPEDLMLKQMQAESYLGATLWGSKGQPVGLIAALGRKPQIKPGFGETLLDMVGFRASWELERLQADEALRASEERYRSIVEDQVEMVCRFTPEGRYVFVNQSFSAFYGVPREQLLGQKWNSDMLGEDRGRVAEVLAGLSVDKPVAGLESRIRNAAGELSWVHFTCRAFFDEQGQVRELQAVGRDITERKRAEQEILQSESRLRSLLTISQSAVQSRQELLDLALGEALKITGSKYGFIFDYNEDSRLFSLNTWSVQAIRDCRMEGSLPPHALLDSGRWSEVVRTRKAFMRNRSQGEGAHPLSCPQGHVPIDRFLVVPVFQGARMVAMVGVANKDDDYIENDELQLTVLMDGVWKSLERMEVMEQLRKAKEEAEASNKAKSEFLANMSHEIRTPLNGVLGMLQILEATPLQDEQKRFLQAATKASLRLNQLLSDILDLSRIEAGKLIVQDASFSPVSLRESVLELFGPTAADKGVRLDFVLAKDVPGVLVGDEARLRQILFNLVGNAIKFTEKGHVRVEAVPLFPQKGRGFRILFTIEDTGIGISTDLLKHIFEPFVQAEDSFSKQFQGAGLGLAIVRKLVGLLHGDLLIDSEEGEGTTMYLTLPFSFGDAPADAAVSPSQADMARRPEPALSTVPASMPLIEKVQAGQALNILLAEDDTVSQMVGTNMLTRNGHRVVAVRDGLQALNSLRHEDFDLVLMDVQMPVMDGVAATKAIRSSLELGPKAFVPIVAMTAYSMAGDKEFFLAAGMNDYISKPVDSEEFSAVIKRVASRMAVPKA